MTNKEFTQEQKNKLARLKVISSLHEYIKVLDYNNDAEEGIIASAMLQSMFDTNLKKDTAEMCSVAIFKNNMSVFNEGQADKFFDTYNKMKELSDRAIMEDLSKYMKDDA